MKAHRHKKYFWREWLKLYPSEQSQILGLGNSSGIFLPTMPFRLLVEVFLVYYSSSNCVKDGGRL